MLLLDRVSSNFRAISDNDYLFTRRTRTIEMGIFWASSDVADASTVGGIGTDAVVWAVDSPIAVGSGADIESRRARTCRPVATVGERR